jgi:hypothetical protein
MFDIWNFYAHLASNIQVNYHENLPLSSCYIIETYFILLLFFIPATLRLVTAYVALPRKGDAAFSGEANFISMITLRALVPTIPNQVFSPGVAHSSS